MHTAAQVSIRVRRQDIANRWLLSTPALFILFVAAIGPLFVMLLFSFLVKGDHGDVKYWQDRKSVV